MNELKPCPFCGGEAELFDNSKDFTADRKRYFIRCKGEKRKGRGCMMIMAFDQNTDKAATIKQWNHRSNANLIDIDEEEE